MRADIGDVDVLRADPWDLIRAMAKAHPEGYEAMLAYMEGLDAEPVPVEHTDYREAYAHGRLQGGLRVLRMYVK